MARRRQLWLLAVLSLAACAPAGPPHPNVVARPEPTAVIVVPELDRVDTAFCSDTPAVRAVAGSIVTTLGDASWEEAQARLVSSAATDDAATSLRLQKARAVIARCAQLLFDAVPTGSAHNLADISLTNALKDVDMSAPIERVEAANAWLRGLMKDPDRTMLMSLLAEPTSSLPCRALDGPPLLWCTRANVLETAQIAILHEIRSVKLSAPGAEPVAATSDLAKLCPSGFILPPPDALAYRVLETTDEAAFAESFPAVPSEAHRYRSATRYRVLFLALKNPAYYLQPGSVRTWVIEREDSFRRDLAARYPEYVAAERSASIEREGAVLEQWIYAMRHVQSFYYRFKYLFRAIAHIGIDVDQELPELAALHRVMKKTRPAALSEVHAEFLRQLAAGAVADEPALDAWRADVSLEVIERAVREGERRQLRALLEYYRMRRHEPESIWNEICRAD